MKQTAVETETKSRN